MRTFRSRKGPFGERPFFTQDEIERTCVEALRATDLYPTRPEPIRIDRFIEKFFIVTPTYENLGPGILGVTKFGKRGVQAVIVSRTLDEENTRVSERRVRSTLAHEAGHGLLHAHLFALDESCVLFGERLASGPKVLCREEAAPGRAWYNGDWWEYQANRAIGSLLMPRALVDRAVDPFMVSVGSLGLKEMDRLRHKEAADHLSDTFDVNRAVAAIRLDELYAARSSTQQSL